MVASALNRRLLCGKRWLDLSRPQVMGILNVTPDSFSDGGRFNRLDDALRKAQAMSAAGAALIDVGGESTRPGAMPVSRQQELERVAPVVEAISERFDVLISVDTSTPEVMLEAARLGASLINDVRALRREGALQAAADSGLAVCLMHMQGEPGSMQNNPHYLDLLGEIKAFLKERVSACAAAGIIRERLLLDPGIGFAKTLAHNLSLLKNLKQLHGLGLPLLIGASRKSLIGQTLGREVGDRLYGSLALAALSLIKGAAIVRVHDVAETMDVLRMLDAVQNAD